LVEEDLETPPLELTEEHKNPQIESLEKQVEEMTIKEEPEVYIDASY
jgi:hypothetical protein